jgi:hypothetical protein
MLCRTEFQLSIATLHIYAEQSPEKKEIEGDHAFERELTHSMVESRKATRLIPFHNEPPRITRIVLTRGPLSRT